MRSRTGTTFAVRAVRRCLTVGLSVALLGPLASPSAASSRHAVAGVYATGDFAVSYAVAAQIALPEARGNRSWYADWIMLVARRGDDAAQPFVQLGLIRGFGPHDPPHAFVAWQAPGGEVVFKRLGDVENGRHRVAIAGNDRVVRLAFDERLVAELPRTRFFSARDRVYAQYAAEVAAPGDRPTGYLRDLSVETDQDFGPHAPARACLRYDRGVSLDRSGDRLVPRGRFAPEAPSGFTDCPELRIGGS